MSLKKTSRNIETVLSSDKNLKWQILEVEKTGTYLVYMKAKLENGSPDTAFFEPGGGYLVEPFDDQ
jgi:hypothetical protein